MRWLLPWLIVLCANGNECAQGIAAVKARDFATAEPILSRCIQSAGAPVEAFAMLSGVYQAQGNAAALLATALKAIERYPADLRFYLTAGTLAGRAKQWPDSIRILEAAIKRWPADEKIRSLLASAHAAAGAEALDAGRNDDASTLR